MSLSALAENADERRRRQNRESQQRCRERRRQREPSQHLSRSTGSTARRPCKQHSLPSDPSPNITEGPQIVCKVSSISDASSEGFLSKMSSPSRSLPPGQPLSWSMPFEDTVLADTFANSHSAIPLSPMFYPQERITRDLGSSLRTSMESYDTISRDIPSPVGNQSQKYRCTCSHKKDCKGRKGHYRLAASISSGSSAHMSPYDVHVHQRESEDTEEYGPKLLGGKYVTPPESLCHDYKLQYDSAVEQSINLTPETAISEVESLYTIGTKIGLLKKDARFHEYLSSMLRRYRDISHSKED